MSRAPATTGSVVGIDLNPTMCRTAVANVGAAGGSLDCREGRMEEIPAEDDSVDVVLSNGMINLSFRKRRVIEVVFRVLAPGGRVSITDIVSAKALSENVVQDPKSGPLESAELSRRESSADCSKRPGSRRCAPP